jgi:hypothetical protein
MGWFTIRSQSHLESKMRKLASALVFVTFAKLHSADLTGEAVLQIALEGESRQEKLRQEYVWHEHVEAGPAKADGSRIKVNFTRDFDVTFLNGAFYRELVAVNGKPVKSGTTVKHTRHTGVPLAAILSVMNQELVRVEEIGNRKYWVVQSKPKKNVVAATSTETEALSYQYTHWIDQEDKSIFRVKWEVIAPQVETKPGSWTTLDFAENENSVRLLRHAQFFIVTGDKFGAKWVFQTNDYSGYRKFSADSKIDFDHHK